LDEKVLDLEPGQLKELAGEIELGMHAFIDLRPSHHCIIVKLPFSENIFYEDFVAMKPE